jgi:hypothetical protein
LVENQICWCEVTIDFIFPKKIEVLTNAIVEATEIMGGAGKTENLQKHKRKQQLGKMQRLALGRPKHKDEKYMDEKKVDEYIAHMALQLPDDPEVADRLLVWKKIRGEKQLSKKNLKQDKDLKTRELDLKEKELTLKYQQNTNPLDDDIEQ